MKKLYAAAMVLAFALSACPFAQEGVTKTPEAAAEPAKEVKKGRKEGENLGIYWRGDYRKSARLPISKRLRRRRRSRIRI